MEDCGQLIEFLGPDLSYKILGCLEDPSDLVRVSAVSRSCRNFVISNELCKQFALRTSPEISSITHVIEAKIMIQPFMLKPKASLEKNNAVYSLLARGLESSLRKDCISDAIEASSTDNYPEESIQNTLDPFNGLDQRGTYWSSKGESDPTVPETLTYKLTTKLCVITEIHVQPFQAYFQPGHPIYSANSVRFRMGHPYNPVETNAEFIDGYSKGPRLFHDKFVWTYTSPEFPMVQENCLQKFKLPEPVLCIGGILQIEMLGRIQKQDMDSLYYICVAYVEVVGRPLSAAFDVEILDHSGNCSLKYYPQADCSSSSKLSKETGASSRLRTFTARLMERGVRGWEQIILNSLLGHGVAVSDDESDDEIIS